MFDKQNIRRHWCVQVFVPTTELQFTAFLDNFIRTLIFTESNLESYNFYFIRSKEGTMDRPQQRWSPGILLSLNITIYYTEPLSLMNLTTQSSASRWRIRTFWAVRWVESSEPTTFQQATKWHSKKKLDEPIIETSQGEISSGLRLR